MLYHLIHYLDKYYDIPGSGMFLRTREAAALRDTAPADNA